jgi:hypothetical protein
MTPEELVPLIRESKEGLLVPCWVQPRASRTSIAGIHGDCIKTALNAPPVDGKANAELCAMFAGMFKLPKSAVELVSGQTSRKKTILLRGLAKDAFIRKITS